MVHLSTYTLSIAPNYLYNVPNGTFMCTLSIAPNHLCNVPLVCHAQVFTMCKAFVKKIRFVISGSILYYFTFFDECFEYSYLYNKPKHLKPISFAKSYNSYGLKPKP